MKTNNKAGNLTIALLVVYLIALVWIVLFKMNVQFAYMNNNRSVNLIPFNEPLILNGKIDLGENRLLMFRQ